MRRILILLFLTNLTILQINNAQTNKGRIVLSFSSNILGMNIGSSLLNTSYSWEGDNEQTALNLTPRIGCFLGNNIAGGVDISLFYTSSKSGSDKATNTISGLGPFIRFYNSTTKNTKPFFELNASYLSSKSKYNDVGYSVTIHIYNFFVGAGISYFAKENLAFEVVGGYSCYIPSNEDSKTINSLSLKVGIVLLFDKKEKK